MGAIAGYDAGYNAGPRIQAAHNQPSSLAVQSTPPAAHTQTQRAAQAPQHLTQTQSYTAKYPPAQLLLADRLQPTQPLIARHRMCQTGDTGRMDKTEYSQKLDRLNDLSRMSLGQSRKISLTA